MPPTTPIETNFLYQITAGSRVYSYTNIAEDQLYGPDSYLYMGIDHTRPTFSGEPQDGEIDLTMPDTGNPIADLFLLSAPPYKVKVQIFEYDRETDIATPYYTGWIIRPAFSLEQSTVSFHLVTAWYFFQKESLSDSLSALSRYSIFDPRSGVDIESFRVGITITDINETRDVLTVTGITQPDAHFNGGLLIAPDRDMRSILTHETVLGDVQLTLNGSFPQVTLDTGFTADIYPGDDLVYDTWASRFGASTNKGEAFGGWPFMPSVDPAVRGVI